MKFRNSVVTKIILTICAMASYVGCASAIMTAILVYDLVTSQFLIIVFTASVGVITVVSISLFLSRNILTPLMDVRSELGAVASGKIDIPDYDLLRKDEIGEIQRSIVMMTNNLQEIVITTMTVTDQLTASAEEFTSSIEEINASAEEISSVIQQMNRGAQQQAEQVNTTVTVVHNLSEVLEKTMQDISAAVLIITDVANRTNMLALNAAIEAARAGDYGRGFAVVADNVRRLAEDTKNHATEINETLDRIRRQISDNVQIITKTVDSVAAVAEETAASSEEASAATEEQTATMEEINATTHELTDLSQRLMSSVSRFKILPSKGLSSSPIRIKNSNPITVIKNSSQFEEIEGGGKDKQTFN
ncbi:MAG: methyl-accepting chemotaxis protein [Candidatus Odinarchaeota archaeon]